MQKRRKANGANEKLRKVLKFLLKLNVFAIPLILIIYTNYQSGLLMGITTTLSYKLVSATMEAQLVGNLIAIPVENGLWAARIGWDSTGWKSILALFALIFATEFPLKKKIMGLALLPAVYLVNLFRIWFMFFAVKNYGVQAFETLHNLIWSWGLIITILVLWIIWMRYFPEDYPKLKKFFHTRKH
jgi:exosortase/archaeosortase family protein